MGKLSEEVKAIRAKERKDKKTADMKRERETKSAINAQKIRKRQRRK